MINNGLVTEAIPVITIVPTAGGLALVNPKGYEFLVYESGHTIPAPERTHLKAKTA